MQKRDYAYILHLLLTAAVMLPSTIHAQKEVYIIDLYNQSKDEDRLYFIASSVNTEAAVQKLMQGLQKEGEKVWYWNSGEYSQDFDERYSCKEQGMDAFLAEKNRKNVFEGKFELDKKGFTALQKKWKNARIYSLDEKNQRTSTTRENYFNGAKPEARQSNPQKKRKKRKVKPNGSQKSKVKSGNRDGQASNPKRKTLTTFTRVTPMHSHFQSKTSGFKGPQRPDSTNKPSTEKVAAGVLSIILISIVTWKFLALGKRVKSENKREVTR